MARDALADLEAVLGGGVALARETAIPVLGGARYLTMGRERADASDALDWSRELLGPVSYTPSKEGQQAQREMAQALMTGVEGVYERTPIKRIAESRWGQGVGEAVGGWWEGLSEDVKAGAEMLASGLDMVPGGSLAGFLPTMIRGKRGVEATAETAEWLPPFVKAYHGTHAEIDEFDPVMVDLGVHVGSVQQAENRLKDIVNERRGGGFRGGVGFDEGANVMPVEFDPGRQLEMEDIGTWNDSARVAEELNKLPGNEGRFDDILYEADDVKRSFEDNQDWIESPENREMLDELGDALRDDYDTIRYQNKVENKYGDDAGFVPEAQARLDEIRREQNEIKQTVAGRNKPPTLAQIEALHGDEGAINKLFDDFHKNEPKPTPDEQARIDALDEEHMAIYEDPANRADPNSYIVLNPEQARSSFDPKVVKQQQTYLEKTDKPNTYKMGDREDITPLNIDMRNPLVVDLDQGDKKPKQWELDLAEAFDERRIDDLALKSEGHDGVIIKRPGGDHDYKLISLGQINDRATDQLLQDALDFRGDGLDPKAKWKWADPEGKQGEGGNPNVPKGRYDDPNWHPISESRMGMPYDEMTSTHVQDPDVLVNELELIQAEDMRGEWQMTSPWDRTTGGTIITEVNGKPLANPVKTEGGQRFINIDNEGVLASGETVVKGYENRARSVPAGDRVNIAPSAMSHTSSDFSTMGAEVHANRLPEYPVSDEAKATFDQQMWEGTGSKKDALAPQPKWPGLDDPDLAEKLKAPGMGGVRIRFLQLMDKAEHKKAGFPDTPSTRKAVQDATLEDVPIGWSGGTIGEWDLTQALSESGHTSYPVKAPGQGRGTLGKDLPPSVMQADHIARRRLVGQGAGGDSRSIEMSKPIQQITPELAQIMDVHPGLRRPGGPQ